MKVKKQRRHRKVLRFFTTCFGLRKPFKVLCDGTFVNHLIVNRITPADDALANILTAPVKLYTTRCEHEKCTGAEACVIQVIGENNSEHFFVASQDTDLRKKLREVPGVPLIYGLRNTLFLEPISAFQLQYVKTSGEKRLHMDDREYQIFRSKVMNRLSGEEADEIMENKDSRDETIKVEALKRSSTARNPMEIKDKPQFKRKRAKGPNPLSCKKKKSRESQNVGTSKETKQGDRSENAVRRSRKRKRSQKRQTATEA
ncbi:uncharacterized protein [Arachis hypogaea]|uniref:uncharacterized protein isoform X2 n=1 Tax=Arachis hypogaea TaxID=3818 RepID=UPI000DEC0BE9|nr:rRNA-processing protein UTP23 homolog isoform X2 [Arachis hypogaea]